MSHTQPVESSAESVSSLDRTPRFPKKMLIFTVILIGLMTAAFGFVSEIDDAFGIGMDYIMVGSMFFTILLIALWAGWFMVLSDWPWLMRIFSTAVLISLPLTFLAVFRPVLGGDVNFLGFRPIWEADPERPAAEASVAAGRVDLKTETPQDFAQFLGSQQNSTVVMDGEIDAAKFGDAKILWKQPIGQGWSGFVARNGFAVTMEQRQEQECVTCYAIETGELQWLYGCHARHRDKMNLGGVGPRSTPCIHDGRVYALGAVGNFVCLDGTDGAVVWQVNLNELLGVPVVSEKDDDGLLFQYEGDSSVAWGRSGSPLIVGDVVVIPGGGPISGEKKTLLAFDLLTGELRWSGGDQMIAYGSPTRATVAGTEQILMVAETQAMGFDPANGNVLWTWARPGETNGGANTSQLTVVSATRVLTTKGYSDGGGELIELSNIDGRLVPASIWKNEVAIKTKLTSPVIYDGHSYALSNGFLECLSLDKGQRIWKRRGRFGHGQLLLINDMLLLHSETGTLFLIAASADGYKERGTLSTISGVCWNTLCLYGDTLLVRSDLEATCIQLPVK